MESIVQNSIHQKQELMVRMERNNKTVQRLSKKLGSYTCEPKNRTSFEQFNEIKQRFNSFSNHQKRLMELLQQKKNGLSDSLEKEIQQHLKRYRELESAIAAYLLDLGKTL